MRTSIGRPALRGACAGAVLLAVLAAAPNAEAQSAGRKFGRGLAGVTLGVLEVPGHIMATSESQGLLAGLTLGTAKGVGYFVLRELVGAYELVTAPIPVPAGYAPVMHPEYPWEHLE